MIRNRGVAGAIAVVAALACLTLPTRAQDFGERSMKPSVPVENRPKVDEKAYKAALEKIPSPARNTIRGGPRGRPRGRNPQGRRTRSGRYHDGGRSVLPAQAVIRSLAMTRRIS